MSGYDPLNGVFTQNFLDITKAIFNSGYSLLTSIHYPGTVLTPLVLILTGSAVIVSIKFIRKTLVEV